MLNKKYYFLAIITIIIWSSTFISTKVLLNTFSPIEILVYRFTLAYILMFLVYPQIHKPESLKTEIKIALAGLSGGTIYFIAENYALKFSLASNVSLLVSTAPILTSIGAHFLLKNEKINKSIILGGIIAFIGVSLVIFNGKFILKLNPLGDFLAICSAFSWAIYSILIKKLNTKYSILYITRKIFFYTLLTVLPVLFFNPIHFNLSLFFNWTILANMLFLTVFASCGAYVIWSKVIWALGASKANNFIYFIPLLTITGSSLLLQEPLTPYSFTGAALIFAGVYITSRKP